MPPGAVSSPRPTGPNGAAGTCKVRAEDRRCSTLPPGGPLKPVPLPETAAAYIAQVNFSAERVPLEIVHAVLVEYFVALNFSQTLQAFIAESKQLSPAFFATYQAGIRSMMAQFMDVAQRCDLVDLGGAAPRLPTADAETSTADLATIVAAARLKSQQEALQREADELDAAASWTGGNARKRKATDTDDVEAAIDRLKDVQRQSIDAANVAEFVLEHDPEGDGDHAARTAAAVINRRVQMRQSVVDNQDGPLANSMRAYWSQRPAETGPPPNPALAPAPDGIAGRLADLEAHLNVHYAPAPIPVTVFDRIKLLESKICALEALAPAWAAEHFCAPDADARAAACRRLGLDDSSQAPQPPATWFSKLSHVRFAERVRPPTNGDAAADGDAPADGEPSRVVYVSKKDPLASHCSDHGSSVASVAPAARSGRSSGPKGGDAGDNGEAASRQALLADIDQQMALLKTQLFSV